MRKKNKKVNFTEQKNVIHFGMRGRVRTGNDANSCMSVYNKIQRTILIHGRL
jgi:hypothetical protein